jgi:hypothetical protein
MKLSLKRRPNVIRSMFLGTVAIAALSSTGCTAQAGDETELDDPLEDVATEGSEYTLANRTIPWRGAPKQANAKSSARFGQIDAVYGADIYHGTTCTGGRPNRCIPWVHGMKVFMHDEEDNTTHQGPIGVTSAQKTTRQVCPSQAPYVVGYRLNVGSGVGFTKVEGFGLTCGSADGFTEVDMPIVGNNAPLFPDFLYCRRNGDLPMLVGSITMNNDGTGIGANCVFP